jgi:hypothetical protein
VEIETLAKAVKAENQAAVSKSVSKSPAARGEDSNPGAWLSESNR